MLRKLSLPAFLTAGILVFLPWFSITANGAPVREVLGLNLITGYEVFIPVQNGTLVLRQIAPNVIAIGVALVILIGCLSFFIKGKLASIVSLALGFLGIVLLAVLQFDLSRHLNAYETVVVTDALLTFWFVGTAFLVAAGLSLADLLVVRQSSIDDRYLPIRGPKASNLDIPVAFLCSEAEEEDDLPFIRTIEEPAVAAPFATNVQIERFCHKCGEKALEGMGFCHKCGVRLISVN